jgi:hypothetical protein
MSDKDPKVVFKSGATSSAGHDTPYGLMTGYGRKAGALRFGAGNVKHEDGTTVYAEANWLKAYHTRDLEFFRNRAVHASDHLDAEMQGQEDDAPGGNIGGVAWFLDVAGYVKANDPEFWKAIQGIRKHPGPRNEMCTCPRCLASGTKWRHPIVYTPAKKGPVVSGAQAAGLLPRGSEMDICCPFCLKMFAPSEFCNMCERCHEDCKCH